MLSQPPFIRATTAGMAAFKLDSISLSLCEIIAILIELHKWVMGSSIRIITPYVQVP